VDALPRADVNTTLTEDALRLVDMEELLGPELVGEVVTLDEGKLVVIAKRRGLIDHAFGHHPPPLTSVRP
jgi:hypothetical protein